MKNFKKAGAALLAMSIAFAPTNVAHATSETYKLNNTVNTYMNASDAYHRVNSVSKYTAGSYYIYKEANGMYNISTSDNSVGSWINPIENTTASSTSETRKITASSLIVRSAKSSLASTILGYTAKGEVFTGVQEGAWFKTTFNGRTAYLAYKFTEPSSSNQIISTETREITSSKLIVRSSNTSSASILGYASKGEIFEGTKVGAWFKTTYNGRTAYLAYQFTGPSQNVDKETRIISSTRLAVRSQASSTSTILGFFNNGDKVEGVNVGAWFRTTFNGRTAYIGYKFTSPYEEVSNELVVEEPIIEEEPVIEEVKLDNPETRYVTASNLNVRSEDNNTSSIVGSLSRGDKVEGEFVGSWLKIIYNEKFAYIHGDYTSSNNPSVAIPETDEKPEEDQVASSNLGQEVINLAMKQIGKRYVYGSINPAVGFDCSGLVYYSYRTAAGVTLGRSSRQMWSNGYQVSYNDMKPGDIMYFGYSVSGINHVGMYVGDGVFIHASSASMRVETGNAYGSWARNNLVGVRRIVD